MLLLHTSCGGGMAKGSENLERLLPLRHDAHAAPNSCYCLAGLRAQDRLRSILETCNLLLGARLHAFVLRHPKLDQVFVPDPCVSAARLATAPLVVCHDPMLLEPTSFRVREISEYLQPTTANHCPNASHGYPKYLGRLFSNPIKGDPS